MLLGFILIVLLFGSTLTLKSSVNDLKIDVNTVLEGSNLTVACNATINPQGEVFWSNERGGYWDGDVLSLTNITRNMTSVYTCNAFNISKAGETERNKNLTKTIFSFFLNVEYPAQLVVVNGSKDILQQHQTFWIYVQAIGNPGPDTTLTSPHGDTIFSAEFEKYYNITVPDLNCTNTGQYRLSCSNKYANITGGETISVLCPPQLDPYFSQNTTVSPRLRENVAITVRAIGYPAPSYEWFHDGTQLFNHTDQGYTTELQLNDISVKYFGDYQLIMRNEFGNISIVFTIKADGPPDPVTKLTVSDVTASSVTLSFVTGYDYNSTQTFVVQREVDGTFQDFREMKDKPVDFGGENAFIVITELDEATGYNLTVISHNSRGQTWCEEIVSFTTQTTGIPLPDPKYPLTTEYQPRLGENVTLWIRALGEPQFYWTRNGVQLNSTDNSTSSEVAINDVKIEDFGMYILNMSNKHGSTVINYTLNIDGPPDPVTHLNVSNVTMKSADVTFITGYNYNDTQTFVIVNSSHTKLTSCEDITSGRGGDPFTCQLSLEEDTLYNITVVSENSRSSSRPSSNIQFFSLGAPKPDPAVPFNDTFTPRLFDTVNLTIHAVGFPPPKFEWKFKGKLIKSTDAQYTSTVTIDRMAVENFGDYKLNMTNKVGNYTHVYRVVADGPPQAVSGLRVSNLSASGVEVSFTTGYNYNNTQIFQIAAYNHSEHIVLKSCKDTTSGHGGDPFTCNVQDLAEDTAYNVTIISENSRGQSFSSESVSFTSYGKPDPDPSKPLQKDFKPRLEEPVNLTIHAVGYPPPEYEWNFNGKLINSTDTNYTSTVTIKHVHIGDFGTYNLTMTNAAGSSSVVYSIIAEGKPEPATGLVSDKVTSDSVDLAWKPGYDYEYIQTFTIYDISGNAANSTLRSGIKDTTQGGKSGNNQTLHLSELTSSTNYTITVVASNRYGNALASNTVSFKTLDSGSSTGENVAEIVGFVVGGVGAFVLILVIIALIRCRLAQRREPVYKHMNRNEEEQEVQPHHYRYDDAAAT